jgi:hypothetical protein
VITAPPRAADSLIAAAQGINTPFVVAFAVIALVLAVLITASVVAAAVLASYRRIGVLKSVGFTPAQVTATYAVTLAAVTFGLTAVVLATGLGTSLAKLSQGGDLWQHAVVVWAGNKGPAAQRFTPSQQQAMASALAHQPGTASYAAMTTPITPNGGSTSHSLTASVPGAGQQVSITAFRSDASRLAWDITSGHWYTGPGQVVINAAEPGTVGLTAGHAIRITVGGVTVTATITGTVDDPGVVGALLTSWQTLHGATGLTVSLYIVALLPGVKPPGYVAALGKRLGHGYTAEVVTPGQSGSIGLYGDIDTSLIRLLTILVAALAGLGVLNATLMLTRERVHDLGVHKAVGMTPRAGHRHGDLPGHRPRHRRRGHRPARRDSPAQHRHPRPGQRPARAAGLQHHPRQRAARLHRRRAHPAGPRRPRSRHRRCARPRRLGRHRQDYHRPAHRIAIRALRQ